MIGQTGQLLDHNMFAYCGNNPINRHDPSGYFWEFMEELVAQIGNAINAVKPAYAVSGGAALADGPLPIGDAIGLAIASAATVGAVGYGIYKTITGSNTIINTITNAIPISHGNSKKSNKPQHGYEIYNVANGDVVKCGISGGKIRLDGKSYRAEKQVRKFNSDPLDGNVYASRIVAYLPNRASALLWEEAYSQLLWDSGNSMSKHKRPRPWE